MTDPDRIHRPRVLVVVGTRPEAIKMAPVVRALRARPEVETLLLTTGQHGELAATALRTFGLPADRDLAIMREGQSVFEVGSACLEEMGTALADLAPDFLLVQGDTASVFFSALSAHLSRVRVGHVEAGLRSHDRAAPWPEESFRRMTAVLADLHFAPTPRARANLLAEGVAPESIHLTGNPIVDALRAMVRELPPRASDPVVASLLDEHADGRTLVLLTAHRRESFGEPLRRIFHAARRLVEEDPRIDLLCPLHPNPQVGEAAASLEGHPRIHRVPPLSYPDLLAVLRRAALVLTDSGGIQEEAPTFGVPVVVLRDRTERPEGVAAGIADLAGSDPARILERARHRLSHPHRRRELPNPYGDGRAGERIADLVVHELTGAGRRTSDWDPEEAPRG